MVVSYVYWQWGMCCHTSYLQLSPESLMVLVCKWTWIDYSIENLEPSCNTSLRNMSTARTENRRVCNDGKWAYQYRFSYSVQRKTLYWLGSAWSSGSVPEYALGLAGFDSRRSHALSGASGYGSHNLFKFGLYTRRVLLWYLNLAGELSNHPDSCSLEPSRKFFFSKQRTSQSAFQVILCQQQSVSVRIKIPE